MNENQQQTSEVLATKIMRFLAVVGVIALLVFAIWVIVQGVALLSNKNDSSPVADGVSNVTTTDAGVEFTSNIQTMSVDELVSLTWKYSGNNDPRTYTFSYSCSTATTTFNVLQITGWMTLPCNTPLVVDDIKITLIPVNNFARFSDVEVRVETGEHKDTMIVTILNNGTLRVATSTETISTTTDEIVIPKKPVVSKPVVSTPVVTKPKIVPMYNGPANLDIEILETGIVKNVSRENVFFSVSPIPTNKTAAVTFLVTNKGGVTSGDWKFKAELPVEGDKDYKYTSPTQSAMLSGMQIKFTLSFEELLEARNGTIKITLMPSDSTDASSNNTDSVTIKIDER